MLGIGKLFSLPIPIFRGKRYRRRRGVWRCGTVRVENEANPPGYGRAGDHHQQEICHPRCSSKAVREARRGQRHFHRDTILVFRKREMESQKSHGYCVVGKPQL